VNGTEKASGGVGDIVIGGVKKAWLGEEGVFVLAVFAGSGCTSVVDFAASIRSGGLNICWWGMS
jgi:hypothetical protein